MTFAPECCAKCSKYTRETCAARNGQCPAYVRELETTGFWEAFRAWVLGGCQPAGKEVWRYWVPGHRKRTGTKSRSHSQGRG